MMETFRSSFRRLVRDLQQETHLSKKQVLYLIYRFMKLSEIKKKDPFIPIAEDPSVPRPFKGVDVINEAGEITGQKFATFDPNVLPKPNELDLSHGDDLSDPSVYASVILGNESVDLPTPTNLSALDAAEIVTNLKSNI